MNYISATVLIVSIGNEAESFSFICRLYTDFRVLELFDENFGKIKELCKKFHKTLEKYDLELEKHIIDQGLDDIL